MKALIVIDMQNDFVYNKLKNSDAETIIPVISSLIKASHQNNIQVFFTKDTHDNNYLQTQEGKMLPIPHCIKNTSGHDIVEYLTPFPIDTIIEKYSFGFNKWSPFLEGIDEVYLTGTCTDICVISNAITIKSNCPEIKINVIKDACAGSTKELHEKALEVMKSCQVNIISSEEFIHENQFI